MFERIDISEIQTMLHYKDRRSVRKWCRNNGVKILCDTGSNKQYVLKEELDNAMRRIFNEQQSDISIHRKEKENRYKPAGIYELSFLNLLQNL